MRRVGRAAVCLMVMLSSCRPMWADIVTPTPVPAATSYVAPLQTPILTATAETTALPTPQPEDITPSPEIITVEPAPETSPVSTAGATTTAGAQP